jgi:AmiR/NasT family two-component response regulator
MSALDERWARLARPSATGDERCEEDLAEARQQIANLQAALETRHTIGLAQGLLMGRYGLTEDQAFAYLARISQDRNVKLRELARRLVAGDLVPGDEAAGA